MSFDIKWHSIETLNLLRVVCAEDGRDTDSYWQMLTVTDRCWQMLTATDSYWQILTDTDRYWQLLTATVTKLLQGMVRIWHAVESSWNVMAHGDAREGKWRGNWPMAWVASTLHTTSKHGVSSITTADAHTSAASSRLNWRPRRFKWTRPFRRKTKCGFCACAITFQLVSIVYHHVSNAV